MAALHKAFYVSWWPDVPKRLISRHGLTTAMQEATGGPSIAGYLSLLRVGNCVMAALGMLLAAIISAGLDSIESHLQNIVISVVIVVSFTGAGNAMNDYFDRETDRIAHPRRPLPTGRVTPGAAILVSGVLFLIAGALSFFVGWWSVIIVLTSVFVMISYELALKREGLAGNFAISWLTGALFLFGGASVDSMDVAWILCALAFLATMGREIVKDIQDVGGDAASRQTLPMRVGERDAGIVASGFFLSAVALSPIPYVLDLLSIWYVPAVAVADAIFIYCALVHFANPSRGQMIAKVAMLVALIAFLLGGIL